MGYGTRNNGQIKTFIPDNDDNTIYLRGDMVRSVQDIVEECQEKWPDASLEELTICAEQIQTDCLGYPGYDPGDYTTFIVIKRE